MSETCEMPPSDKKNQFWLMSFANERGLLLKRNRSKWNFQKKTFPRRVTVFVYFLTSSLLILKLYLRNKITVQTLS